MPTLRNSAAFADVVSALLQRGNVVRFRANGCSMGTAIRDGEAIYVEPIEAERSWDIRSTIVPTNEAQPIEQDRVTPRLQPLQVSGHDFSRATQFHPNGASAPAPGDILLTQGVAGFKAHRLITNDLNLYITQGDSVQTEDTPVTKDQILGRVIAIEPHTRIVNFARTLAGRARRIAFKLLNLKPLDASY